MRYTHEVITRRALVIIVGAATYVACGHEADPFGRDRGAVIALDTTTPPADDGHLMLCAIGSDLDIEQTVIVHEGAHHGFLDHGGHLGPCHLRPWCEDHEHAWSRKEVKPHKAAVCHIPPGNPANAHTIVVSKNAVKAHLAHGDLLGYCSRPHCEHDDDATIDPSEAPTPPAPAVDGSDGAAPPDGGESTRAEDPSTDEAESCPEGIATCASGGSCGDGLVCAADSCCLTIDVY